MFSPALSFLVFPFLLSLSLFTFYLPPSLSSGPLLLAEMHHLRQFLAHVSRGLCLIDDFTVHQVFITGINTFVCSIDSLSDVLCFLLLAIFGVCLFFVAEACTFTPLMVLRLLKLLQTQEFGFAIKWYVFSV